MTGFHGDREKVFATVAASAPFLLQMRLSERARKDVQMRKIEIDHLLEAAVAKALNVSLPANRRRAQRPVKKTQAHRNIRHAA